MSCKEMTPVNRDLIKPDPPPAPPIAKNEIDNDYEALIILCEGSRDDERLARYLRKRQSGHALIASGLINN